MSVVDDVHRRLWSEPRDTDLDHRVRELVAEALPLAPEADRSAAEVAVLARVSGLGPLHELADDPSVSEIMVNAGSEVWVERAGRLERTALVVEPDTVVSLGQRLAALAGRRLDRSSPSVDARLPDGSRLHAILPPLAVDGPALTIRRFATRHIGLPELAGTSSSMLQGAVEERKTIVVVGATSSGKTTLLNALGSCIGDDRVVTIEDAAELSLGIPHVVRLETRAATEGSQPVDQRALVREALRMRPDRIICGEMRGAEAFDLIQAMNTGHPGSMTTVHANGLVDALHRIETMVLLADSGLPLQAIRNQLASCIDLLVHVGRTGDDACRAVLDIAAPELGAEGWRLLPANAGDR